jgi:hypothetical protein
VTYFQVFCHKKQESFYLLASLRLCARHVLAAVIRFRYIQASCQGGYVQAHLIQPIDVKINIKNQKTAERVRYDAKGWSNMANGQILPHPALTWQGALREGALAEKNGVTRTKNGGVFGEIVAGFVSSEVGAGPVSTF